jgi:opacity protein-like surface antigen
MDIFAPIVRHGLQYLLSLALPTLACGGYSTRTLAADSVWSGFYIGGDFGLDFAKASRWNTRFSPFYADPVIFPLAATSVAAGGTSEMGVRPAGALRLGGSTVVWDRILLGLEGEIAYARSTAKFSASRNFSDGHFFGAALSETYASQDTIAIGTTLDWTAALRARFGILALPDVLVFASVGPALAHASVTATHNGAGATTVRAFFPVSSTSVSAFNLSLTAGTDTFVPGISWSGGVEYKIAPQLSLRAEYTYAQFRRLN